MAKLEKWLTISNKLETAIYDGNKYGINLFFFIVISAILANIAIIINCFKEDTADVLIIIAMIFVGIWFVFVMVEILITDVICCRVLVPKYFEKQIRSAYSNKVPEIIVKSIGHNNFLIKFENCTNECIMQEKDKIVPIVLQIKKEIEKYWRLKSDWYFEDSSKNRYGPYC